MQTPIALRHSSCAARDIVALRPLLELVELENFPTQLEKTLRCDLCWNWTTWLAAALFGGFWLRYL